MKLSIPEIKYAQFHGYDVQLKTFGHLDKLVKDRRHVWCYKVYPNKWIFRYMTADLVDGEYLNKESFDSYYKAVMRPITLMFDTKCKK